MVFYLSAVACLLQLSSTLARPTAQSTPYAPCSETDTTVYNYVNNDGGHAVDGTPFVGGLLCDGDGTCASSLTETYSVSTTITVGTSFSLDIEGEFKAQHTSSIMNLTSTLEIFHVGVDFSVAHTTGTAIGEGGSDTCPKGNWECALKVTPYLIEISGNVTPSNLCDGDMASEPYTIQAPHTDQSGSKYHLLNVYRLID